MSRDRLRLLHIRDAIERIHSYATSQERFLQDPMVQDAVIRNLEVIGEAAKQLSPETIATRPDIPGLRSPRCGTGSFMDISPSIFNSCGMSCPATSTH